MVGRGGMGGNWAAIHGDAITKELPPLNWKMLIRLFHYMQPYAWKRNLLFVLTFARAIQKPAGAWMIPMIIRGPIERGDWSLTIQYAIAFLALVIFTELTFHFRQRLALEIGESVVHDLRRDLFKKIEQQTLAYFEKIKLGNVLSRMISDIENVRRGVQNVFFFTILLVGQMLFSALFMLFTDKILFSLLLLIAPIIYFVNKFFHKRMSFWSRKVQASQSSITGKVAETVNGIKVIQSYGIEDHNHGEFKGLIDDNAVNHSSLARNTAVFLPVLEFNTFLFSGLVFLLGATSITLGWDQIELGDLVTFFFLSNFFFFPIQNIGRLYTLAVISMAGAERVFAFIDSELKWKDKPNAKNSFELEGRVDVRNLSFEYVPDTPVLKDINFSIEKGKSVALVGHTGSGKTTIFNLLCKFYEVDDGQIALDGMDLNDLDQMELRQKISLVPQAPFLFTGNIWENIRVGNPEATNQEILDAIEALDCKDLFERLPHGLNTEVGEHGKNISNGQRQLICFVRAMIRNPRIVLLDEATSSIDILTEKRVQNALNLLLKGRTNIIIAHRLSTIVNVDQILVMNKGEIVERGTHQELCKVEGGVYQELSRDFGISTESAA
ncbi:MAG: ABC transporter ATP-binding protein/permease [Opitutales bacterium]|nr:ABC transporter ATP-binding protein/permease [Opitutales bacterium]